MAGGDEQIHMVEGTLAPHKILGAAHHLVGRRRVQHRVKKPICRQTESGPLASSQEDGQSGFMTEVTPSCQSP